jgi:glycerophosphoryl diester phosphodiesterase
MTLANCRQLDAGHGFIAPDRTHPFRARGITIPTLAEVLTSFPEAMITVEVKQQTPPIGALLAALLRDTNSADRVLLAALDAPVLTELRQACPGLPSSFSFHEVGYFYEMVAKGNTRNYHPPGNALQIPRFYKGKNLIFPAAIATAHDLGLEVHVWTMNDAKQMRDLLDLGVDGIMSDDPRLLGEVARSHRS